MYLLPIFFTFISFFFSFFFGKKIGNFKNHLINIIFVLLSTIFYYLIFFEVSFLSIFSYIKLADWIVFDLFNVYWSFIYDSLTVTMLIVIMTISLCAHVYSISYMEQDPHNVRFMSYLSLFTFFMLILVTASNLIQLFIGWEGVGICSYLLINFWYTRVGANKSSIMAVFVNKFGDISLLIAFAIIFQVFKSFDFSIIFSSLLIDLNTNYAYLNNDNYYLLFYICILMLIGAVAKSAQVGLHFWLPEAMEGPTPVSSLIHAATMVTAGVFLIVRSSFLFEEVPSILIWISFFGSFTTFFGSTVGLFQYDIKKIIAYSTCSQLGYMFLSCGLSSYYNGMYHLLNHAFFKALLFLTAGYIIHALSNEQDLRKMGGLLKKLPLSSMMILIGSISLMGFPYTSGFFSKEKIIELFYNKIIYNFYFINYLKFFYFFQFLAMFSVIITISYSIKMYIYLFLNKFNGYKQYIWNLHYGSFFLIFPLVILSYLSIFSGYLLNDLMIGIGTDYWKYSLFISSQDQNILNTNSGFYLFNFEFIKYIRKIPLVLTFYFIFIFSIIYYWFKTFFLYLRLYLNWMNNLFIFLNRKYLFFTKNIIYPLIDLMNYSSLNFTFKLFDKGIIELFGPYGISKKINYFIKYTSYLQTGLIYHYSGFIILGLISYFFILG
jgi:NADH-ubiquinone oxidoreductase chain 5